MTKKYVAWLALAIAAVVSGHAWLLSGTFERRAWDVVEGGGASASQQLPAGLLLPTADVNLRIASLVAADLDADGDIDVLATENSGGSVKIVVWVNDGAGRLERKAPRKPEHSGLAPASPSVSDGQSASFVTIQSDSYALEFIGVGPWLSLGSQPHRLARSTDPTAASHVTLRSRSPPASPRLS